MAEKYDPTPVSKKKLKKMQQTLKGKGGVPFDIFKGDNFGPV